MNRSPPALENAETVYLFISYSSPARQSLCKLSALLSSLHNLLTHGYTSLLRQILKAAFRSCTNSKLSQLYYWFFWEEWSDWLGQIPAEFCGYSWRISTAHTRQSKFVLPVSMLECSNAVNTRRQKGYTWIMPRSLSLSKDFTS